jgi:hypothetical protein
MKIKYFLMTLFIKQNKYHRFSVLRHTLVVTKYCFIHKKYSMIPAGLLHDIGKPVVAFQDEKDKVENTYSFTGHEEKSYEIIRKWPISNRTKILVRYHYLITGMATDTRKFTKTGEQRFKDSFDKRLEIWNSLNAAQQYELMVFKIFDDLGKGYGFEGGATPDFLIEQTRLVEKEILKKV